MEAAMGSGLVDAFRLGVTCRDAQLFVYRLVVGVFAGVAFPATSLALAAVPECRLRASCNHGLAALDDAWVRLSHHVRGACFRLAARPSPLVGEVCGFRRDAWQPAERSRVRGNR